MNIWQPRAYAVCIFWQTVCIYFILDNELIWYPTREVRRVTEAFNIVNTLERVWGFPPVWARWSPLAENGYRAFRRAKMSPLDTQLNTISCIFLPKIKLNTVTSLKKILKISFQDRLSLNACQKYYRKLPFSMFLTCMKIPFVIEIVFCLFLFGRLR